MVTLFPSLAYAVIGGAIAGALSAQDLERACIKHRTSIHSGIVRIELDNSSDRNGPANRTFKKQIHLYFEAGKIRADVMRDYPLTEDWNVGKQYRETVSIDHEYVRHYSARTFNDGAHVITKLLSKSDKKAKRIKYALPEMIGLVPASYQNLSNYQINHVIAGGMFIPRTEITDELVEGIHCRCVTYDIKGSVPVKAEVCYSVDHSHEVAKVICTAGNASESVICNRFAEVAGYGWFPQHVYYSATENNVPVAKEEMTIEVVEFNRDLPDETFDFLAMKVPLGTKIYDSSVKPAKQWRLTSSGLEQWSERPLVDIKSATRAPIFRRLLLILNAFVCAVLGVWFLWKRRTHMAT